MAMQFELTNEQRDYLGLERVGETWDIVQINEKVFLYFDNEVIRKYIEITYNTYFECQMNEITENNRKVLLPKTARGKAQKLNFSSIEQRYRHGVYFYFGGNNIRIASYTTQNTYFETNGFKKKYVNFDDLQKWIDEWIMNTTEQDLADLQRFKVAERKHAQYKEGDFFAFKIGRREYGFGRILLDIGRLRKSQDFVKGKNYGLRFMGKPLIVKVYHKINNLPNIDIDELAHCDAFPSQQIMDNQFYYGDYTIIGNRKLNPEELDYPISYSSYAGAIYLQYGLIYREMDDSIFSKYLKEDAYGNQRRIGMNPYENNSIGFGLGVLYDVDAMKKCIEEKSNQPYWNTCNYYVQHDLRSPSLQAIKHEIFDAFHLDADASYSENLKKAAVLH